MFSCDLNKNCQQVLLSYHCPQRFYPDITTRDNSRAPAGDWYGAGFPCQPFSSAGLGEGVDDNKERGLLVANSMDYVQTHKPVLVVLENVTGILSAKHLPLVTWVINTLNNLGYQTSQRILNTRDYGVPHYRRRFYVVALLRSRIRRSFSWPTPVDCIPLDEFLCGGRPPSHPGWGVFVSFVLRPKLLKIMLVSLIDHGKRQFLTSFELWRQRASSGEA